MPQLLRVVRRPLPSPPPTPQADPWATRHWWSRCVQRPAEAGDAAGHALLVALLAPRAGGLMWRSSKADVVSELGLPPQHAAVTMLRLGAVELHHYNRQHQVRACAAPGTAAPALRCAQAGRQAGARLHRTSCYQACGDYLPRMRMHGRQGRPECRVVVGAGAVLTLPPDTSPCPRSL
jgi:hypothetical protein